VRPVDLLMCALAFTLFFMMIVVPTVYQPVKALLLAGVLSGIAWRVGTSGRLALHPLIACGSAAFVAIGLVFVLRGIWLGAPGALRMSSVYVLWPAVYTVLIAGAASERVLHGLTRLLVVSTIVICLYSLTYIMWATGWWPTALYLPLDQGQGFASGDGVMEFNLYSITSLIFLVPFVTAMLVLSSSDTSPIGRLWLWMALGLGLIVSILSGRRALVLVLALAPLIAAALRILLRDRRVRRRSSSLPAALGTAALVIVAGVVVRVGFGVRAGAVFEWTAAGFQFSSDPIAMMRASQSAELLSGWWQSPWFGWGYGAIHPTLVRSVEMPWAFELSYLALLFNTGVVGTFFYGVGMAFIFLAGFVMARSGHRLGPQLLAVLVGTTTFLIANATNPYLPKFDYEWVIFLPLAFINLWLLERDDRTAVRLSAPTP
jgi:hypothetical protein